MKSILIKNAQLVNEGRIFASDLLVRDGFIERIDTHIPEQGVEVVIDAQGQYLLPGAIDDQVHFREPGLTHKANIQTEARAAVAGGVTTYMEMPNTKPPTTNLQELDWKYERAAATSLANYSFYMGTTNDNLEQVLQVDPEHVCGVKIFMGSSTGNMLVDDVETLERIFSEVKMLIAVHCEDDHMIAENLARYKAEYGEDIPVQLHPYIRSAEACYASSSKAVALARKHGTRLHILHISTARELELFDNHLPLEEKRVTAEACVHHLWFEEEDYLVKGNFIKWNPAVKTCADRDAIRAAVRDGRIDVVATDHAPHTLAEKELPYTQAPSGGPLVQHSLLAMFDLHKQGQFTLEQVVEKMCHNPARLFRIDRRGYLREGYWADLVLLDPRRPYKVTRQNALSKCGWSPFEGHTFPATVTHTIVSGHLAYADGRFDERVMGKRLRFRV